MQHETVNGSLVQNTSRWESFRDRVLSPLVKQCGPCFSRRRGRSAHEEKETDVSLAISDSPSRISRVPSKDSLPDLSFKVTGAEQFKQPARHSPLVERIVHIDSQFEENRDDVVQNEHEAEIGFRETLSHRVDGATERSPAESEMGATNPSSRPSVRDANQNARKSSARSAPSSEADDPDPERDPEGAYECRSSPERRHGTDLVLIPEGSVADPQQIQGVGGFQGLEPLELGQLSESGYASDVSPQGRQMESRSNVPKGSPTRGREGAIENSPLEKTSRTNSSRGRSGTHSTGTWGEAIRNRVTSIRSMCGDSSVSTPHGPTDSSAKMKNKSSHSSTASGTPPTTPVSHSRTKDLVQSTSHTCAAGLPQSAEFSDVASTVTPDLGSGNAETPSGTSTPRKVGVGDTLPVISELPSEASADSLVLKCEMNLESSPYRDVDLMSERSSNKSRKLSFLPRNPLARGRASSLDSNKDFDLHDNTSSKTKRRSKEEACRPPSSSGHPSPASGYATPRSIRKVAAILLGGGDRSKTTILESSVDEHLGGHDEWCADPSGVSLPIASFNENQIKPELEPASRLSPQYSDDLLAGIFLEEAPATCREERTSNSITACSADVASDSQAIQGDGNSPACESQFEEGSTPRSEIFDPAIAHMFSHECSKRESEIDVNSAPLQALIKDVASAEVDDVSMSHPIHPTRLETCKGSDLGIAQVSPTNSPQRNNQASDIREVTPLAATVAKATAVQRLISYWGNRATSREVDDDSEYSAASPMPDVVPQPQLKVSPDSQFPILSRRLSPPLPVALMSSESASKVVTSCSGMTGPTRETSRKDESEETSQNEKLAFTPPDACNLPVCGLGARARALDKGLGFSPPTTVLAPASAQCLVAPTINFGSEDKFSGTVPSTVEAEEQRFILLRGLQSSSHSVTVSDAGSEPASIHLKLHSPTQRASGSKMDSYSDMSRDHRYSSCSASVSDASSNAPTTYLKLHGSTPSRWQKTRDAKTSRPRRALQHSPERYTAKAGVSQRHDASRRRATSRRVYSNDPSFADAVDCLSLQMGVSDMRR